MKKIKLISFDGDGTLRYPKTTTTTQKPHRIYEIYPQVDEANAQLILIPGTIELLEYCRGQWVIMILLSTNPNEVDIADQQVLYRSQLLWVDQYFDHILSARDYVASKWEILQRLADQHKIDYNQILHIWDSYMRDYASTADCNMNTVLIRTSYSWDHEAIEHWDLIDYVSSIV